MKRKVVVMGLDCAEPSLLFERWIHELPVIREIMKKGVYGKMQSSIPCITVPAWSSMVTGKDTGTLGCYGFRNRKNYANKEMCIVNSKDIKEKRLWDIIGEHELKSIVVGVPQTYPVSDINGIMISCILTPAGEPYTSPRNINYEVKQVLNGEEYVFDVVKFRADDKDRIIDQLHKMTKNHFKIIKHLIQNKPWDFFMFVEIGLDRIQHAFWEFVDMDSPYKDSILNYYKFIDTEIGKVINLIDDETAVIIVSDHGAKTFKGEFYINQWLLNEGFLKLKDPIPVGTIMKIENVDIDWENTFVWGEGGYYGRIWINLEQRESNGIVKLDMFEKMLDQIIAKITTLYDSEGRQINNTCFKPDEIYNKLNGIPPDLIVYFDDLHIRATSTIGHKTVFSTENVMGNDSANHSQEGVFMAFVPGYDLGGKIVDGVDILDIAPTILSLMDIPVTKDLKGSPRLNLEKILG